MGEVVQLFAKRDKEIQVKRLKLLDAYLHRSNLESQIRNLQHTATCYNEFVKSLENQKERFIARSMAKECQQELDKLVAEYTGSYGALSL